MERLSFQKAKPEPTMDFRNNEKLKQLDYLEILNLQKEKST